MSVITASDVKKLREITGAGMMDCKAALEESAGDFDSAIEVLRKKGQKMMAKRADRDANEGVVLALVDAGGTRGIVINICCETDFVSKNEDFVNFAKSIAEEALKHFPSSKEELMGLRPDGKVTVQDMLLEKTAVIGEKIEVKDFERIEGALVVPYIHMGYRAGVVISLNKAGDQYFEAGKNLSMQVAAMKPISVDKDGISQATIDKEIEIRMEVLRLDPKNDGKPADILEKMALGSINKFFQEVTLLNQEYVKGNKQSVAQYLQTVDKDLQVNGFIHVYLK